jgi:hypothetical protein
MAHKFEPRNANRTDWSFSELLNWHLDRGTRADGNPETPGRPWTTKELARRLETSDRTVRNWRWGRYLPQFVSSVEQALFGDNPAYAAWRREFREAFSQGNIDQESELRSPRERRLIGLDARYSIDDFQTYIADTPLIEGAALVQPSGSFDSAFGKEI